MLIPIQANKPKLKNMILDYLRNNKGPHKGNIIQAYPMSVMINIECNSFYTQCLQELVKEGKIIKHRIGYSWKG